MTLRRKQNLEIERIILERRTKIAAELHQDVERARQEPYQELAGGPATDSSDRANADLISDLDNAELSRDLLELRALDAPLARLTGRKYGACLDCDGDIGLERRAYPTAVRCFDCQRPSRIRLSRKSKTFAHA